MWARISFPQALYLPNQQFVNLQWLTLIWLRYCYVSSRLERVEHHGGNLTIDYLEAHVKITDMERCTPRRILCEHREDAFLSWNLAERCFKFQKQKNEKNIRSRHSNTAGEGSWFIEIIRRFDSKIKVQFFNTPCISRKQSIRTCSF